MNELISCLPFTRWIPALSASAYGGNRWDEIGADASHSQLHCNKIQSVREGPQGENTVL